MASNGKLFRPVASPKNCSDKLQGPLFELEGAIQSSGERECFFANASSGFGLFIVLMTQGAALSRAQEPSTTPAPSPQETPSPNDLISKPPFEEAFQRLEWRSIGPANMGGRTAELKAFRETLTSFMSRLVQADCGKRSMAALPGKPIFERQGTFSIGDIALAPSNPT